MEATRPFMPGYGVSTAADGLLPWSWAEERLAASHNYWLATTSPGGAPHAVPVWGLWWEGTFWFSTGADSRKARNLAADQRCTVAAEPAAEAVVVQGWADVVDEPERLARFFPAYEAKYAMAAPADSPVFTVRPEVVFGFTELGLPEDATRWRFSGPS